MRTVKITFFRFILATILGAGALSIGSVPSIKSGTFVTTAAARIGRPLTPLSYAGVARRTTRRAAAYGAAVGAAAYPRAGGCVQVVDAYGRIITRCY